MPIVCLCTLNDVSDELSGVTTFMDDPGDSTGHTEPVESDGGYTNIIKINGNMHVGLRLMNTISIVHRELVFELGAMYQGDHVIIATFRDLHGEHIK